MAFRQRSNASAFAPPSATPQLDTALVDRTNRATTSRDQIVDTSTWAASIKRWIEQSQESLSQVSFSDVASRLLQQDKRLLMAYAAIVLGSTAILGVAVRKRFKAHNRGRSRRRRRRRSVTDSTENVSDRHIDAHERGQEVIREAQTPDRKRSQSMNSIQDTENKNSNSLHQVFLHGKASSALERRQSDEKRDGSRHSSGHGPHHKRGSAHSKRSHEKKNDSVSSITAAAFTGAFVSNSARARNSMDKDKSDTHISKLPPLPADSKSDRKSVEGSVSSDELQFTDEKDGYRRESVTSQRSISTENALRHGSTNSINWLDAPVYNTAQYLNNGVLPVQLGRSTSVRTNRVPGRRSFAQLPSRDYSLHAMTVVERDSILETASVSPLITEPWRRSARRPSVQSAAPYLHESARNRSVLRETSSTTTFHASGRSGLSGPSLVLSPQAYGTAYSSGETRKRSSRFYNLAENATRRHSVDGIGLGQQNNDTTNFRENQQIERSKNKTTGLIESTPPRESTFHNRMAGAHSPGADSTTTSHSRFFGALSPASTKMMAGDLRFESKAPPSPIQRPNPKTIPEIEEKKLPEATVTQSTGIHRDVNPQQSVLGRHDGVVLTSAGRRGAAKDRIRGGVHAGVSLGLGPGATSVSPDQSTEMNDSNSSILSTRDSKDGVHSRRWRATQALRRSQHPLRIQSSPEQIKNAEKLSSMHDIPMNARAARINTTKPNSDTLVNAKTTQINTNKSSESESSTSANGTLASPAPRQTPTSEVTKLPQRHGIVQHATSVKKHKTAEEEAETLIRAQQARKKAHAENLAASVSARTGNKGRVPQSTNSLTKQEDGKTSSILSDHSSTTADDTGNTDLHEKYAQHTVKHINSSMNGHVPETFDSIKAQQNGSTTNSGNYNGQERRQESISYVTDASSKQKKQSYLQDTLLPSAPAQNNKHTSSESSLPAKSSLNALLSGSEPSSQTSPLAPQEIVVSGPRKNHVHQSTNKYVDDKDEIYGLRSFPPNYVEYHDIHDGLNKLDQSDDSEDGLDGLSLSGLSQSASVRVRTVGTSLHESPAQVLSRGRRIEHPEQMTEAYTDYDRITRALARHVHKNSP